jgi:hypothetical protein
MVKHEPELHTTDFPFSTPRRTGNLRVFTRSNRRPYGVDLWSLGDSNP